jgi:hypothetical protein
MEGLANAWNRAWRPGGLQRLRIPYRSHLKRPEGKRIQANRILFKSLLEVNKVRLTAGLGPVPMVGQFRLQGIDELEGNIRSRVRIRRRAVSNLKRIAGGETASLPEVRRPELQD